MLSPILRMSKKREYPPRLVARLNLCVEQTVSDSRLKNIK